MFNSINSKFFYSNFTTSAFLAAFITAGCCVYFLKEKKAIKAEKNNEITATADFKLNQIINWRNEKLANAVFFSNCPHIRSSALELFKTSAQKAGEKMTEEMNFFRKREEYSGIFLVDRNGKNILSTPDKKIAGMICDRNMLNRAFYTGKTTFSDFKRDGNEIRLEIISPLTENRGGKSIPSGAIIFHINPNVFLFPLIQSWPTPTSSIEFLLVRRDGNDVLLLNELKHRKNAALSLRLPINVPDSPEAKGAKGKEGIFEGTDYRGKMVLSSVKIVPASPWFMVAKVDADEIYAPIRRLAYLVIIINITLVLTAGALVFLYRQRSCSRKPVGEKFHNLVEQIPAVTYISPVDEISSVSYISPQVESILGFGRNEYKSDPDLWRKQIHPEDLGKVMRELALSGPAKPFDCEYRMISKDGKTVWIKDRAAYLCGADGKPECLQGIRTDISGQKHAETAVHESELRLRQLSNAIPQIVWAAGADGVVTFLNGQWRDYTGSPAEENTGDKWMRLINPEDSPSVSKQWKMLCNTGNSWNLEFRIRDMDGSSRWFLCQAKPLYDDNGELTQWFGTFTDIQQIKLKESEISASNNESKKVAAHLETRLSELTAELDRVNRQLQEFERSKSTSSQTNQHG